jgi:hypothetical protein
MTFPTAYGVAASPTPTPTPVPKTMFHDLLVVVNVLDFCGSNRCAFRQPLLAVQAFEGRRMSLEPVSKVTELGRMVRI